MKEALDLFNTVKKTCNEIILQLTKQVTSSFINDFNGMNLSNYKTFSKAKEYNSYTKKLAKIKTIYNNLGNAFLA